jgi:hypothetical protein
MAIVTRSTVSPTNQERIAHWFARSATMRDAAHMGCEETSKHAPNIAGKVTPMFRVRKADREEAIEEAVRWYCLRHNLTGPEIAASVAAAIRSFRDGRSAAVAIIRGQHRADSFAWGK